MLEKSTATIYKEIIDAVEKANMLLFFELHKKGEITPELKEDFLEFSNTLREVFEDNPGAFKLDTVYVRIPRNMWIPKYQDYLCSIKKE